MEKSVQLDFSEKFEPSKNALLTAGVFIITILLWITEKLHGISSNVVAFLPITILPALGVLNTTDIRRYSWEVLWLVAGGISMGSSLKNTGLAEWLISLINWQSLGSLAMVLIFVLVAYGIANLVSNTVTATLLIPLATGLGLSGVMGPAFPIASVIVLIGVTVSFSMMLPISTPPNAIAISTGMVQTKDMARAGALVGIAAITLSCLCYFIFWPLILK
jgi:solute carrier family 13 (sodium-dependent dicarboxylate transporter), member 2/3/5